MSENAPDRVSVIIPARNEEANIERCVRSVADQRGVRIREIIVVDDQSTDRTPAILEGLKTAIPGLRVLRIESLPPGWLGKCYALAAGARTASGDWLLFTDADTEHLPGSLAESLERAERERVDLLSLSPGQLTPTWWEKAVIPLVYLQLAKLYRFEDVNDPQSRVAAANGQYMLIRREVYQKAGGHDAIRHALLEDVELARRVKSMGGRLLFLPGRAWVETRMYRSFGAMWEGWTKNLYLLYRQSRRPQRTMLRALALNVAPLIAILGIALVGIFGRANAVSWFVIFGCVTVYVLRHESYQRGLSDLGFPRHLAFYLAPGGLAMSLMVLNSWRAYSRGGNVEWKGREYRTRGATAE